jgi:Isochorismatase family
MQNRPKLTANINALAAIARAPQWLPVIWVKQVFASNLHDAPLEVRRGGHRIVIEGTEGANLLPEIDFGASDTILVKKRYSAFFRTQLPPCAAWWCGRGRSPAGDARPRWHRLHGKQSHRECCRDGQGHLEEAISIRWCADPRLAPRTRLGFSPSSHNLDAPTTVPLIECVDRPLDRVRSRCSHPSVIEALLLENIRCDRAPSGVLIRV